MPKRRQSSLEFNPRSLDATLATIIGKIDSHRVEMCQRFDAQDGELRAIKEQAFKTNGRVSVLELWRDTSKAKLAGIGIVCGGVGTVAAWLAGILLK